MVIHHPASIWFAQLVPSSSWTFKLSFSLLTFWPFDLFTFSTFWPLNLLTSSTFWPLRPFDFWELLTFGTLSPSGPFDLRDLPPSPLWKWRGPYFVSSRVVPHLRGEREWVSHCSIIPVYWKEVALPWQRWSRTLKTSSSLRSYIVAVERFLYLRDLFRVLIFLFKFEGFPTFSFQRFL